MPLLLLELELLVLPTTWMNTQDVNAQHDSLSRPKDTGACKRVVNRNERHDESLGFLLEFPQIYDTYNITTTASLSSPA